MLKNKIFNILLFCSVVIHSSLILIKISNSFDTQKNSKGKTENRVRVVFQEEKLQKDNKNQIVQNERSKNNIEPEKSKYLSEFNNKYERQTVAKNIGQFKNSQRSAKGNNKKNIGKEQAKKGVGKLSFEDLSFKHENLESLASKAFEDDKFDGFSSTSDFIEEIPLGDVTHLNTMEFKFYGFYHRIRQKLEQYWGNSLREKADTLSKQGRKIASNSDKITSLAIHIDQKGNIIKIQLKGTSGVKELDDAAIESFNRAGPFPNPPKGMLQNGTAVIEWGFVVKG